MEVWMKTLQLCVLTTIIMTITIGSLFAGGIALSGIGSRAISMGGAFRGMADDPTAMYWNPAGLGFIDKSCVSVAGAGIMPTSDFTYGGTQPGFKSGTIDAEKKLWLFPNVFAVKAGACKLHYGLGVYVPYGLGAEWAAFDLPTTWVNGTTPLTWAGDFPAKQFKSSIGIVDIHPTVSYKLMDNLSAGLGVSVQYGMFEINKLNPNSITGLGTSYYLPTFVELKGSGIGYGANLGLMYKPMANLSIGVSGKMPSKIDLKGDATLTTYINNVIAAGLGAPGPLNKVHKTDVTSTLNLPGDFGIGLSYKINPAWTVNGDFAYTMWDTLDKLVIEFDTPLITGTPTAPVTVSKSTMNLEWENTMRVSLGTQYWLGAANALRAGFFYDQSPIPDSSVNPTFPDISDKMSGNIGYTRVFGAFSADLSFEHIMFSEREITDQTPDNLIGKYNTAINAFNFALNYNF
jgi:long-chain fatty acid transport protein